MSSPTSRFRRPLHVQTEPLGWSRQPRRRRKPPRKLLVERLEPRQLLSTISGHKFNDLDGDGNWNVSVEPGLPGWTIYLDEAPFNGVLDVATRSFSASSVPIAINDSVDNLPTVTTSKLYVSGVTGLITDVNVTLDITHTWDEDLAVDLVAPSGQKVRLFADVGGNGDNFTKTTLDDSATVSIANGSAPFTGTFRPAQPLSGLNNLAPVGTWRLEITDRVNGDAGSLNSWSITLTTNVVDETYTQTTDGSDSGAYQFNNVLPGTYCVREVPQSGWVETKGSDPTCPAGSAYYVPVQSGGVVQGIDFGGYQPATITGQKWEDLDADGIKDADEPGVKGWTIYADRNPTDGMWDASASTDADGNYTITGLRPGTYTVQEVGQTGWTQTYPAGPGGAYTVSLVSGDNVGGKDFGNFRLGQIRGLKWNDVNGDGAQDKTEPTLPGWTIYLDDLNPNGKRDANEPFTTTASDGSYVFRNLLPGTYTVREEQQLGWTQTYPAGADAAHKVSLASGEDIKDTNFGNFWPGKISGRMWNDRNGDGYLDNGSPDADEPGLKGWEVYVDINDNGQKDADEPSATTGADGSYEIKDLAPGEYTVREVLQEGWGQTVPGPDFGTPELSVAGQAYSGVVPPDTVGDVGLDYYVQATNSLGGTHVTVFDKADGSVVSQFALRSLVAGAKGGSIYTGLNDADPIVLFDHLANRWLLMERGLGTTGNELEIFISDDGDPTSIGSLWTQYRVSGNFPDSKITLWPEAYLIGTNGPNNPTAGVYALDRNATLNGSGGLVRAISSITADGTTGPGDRTMPVDLDGATLPPDNEPGIFIGYGRDNQGTPTLELWEFRPEFATPANPNYTHVATIPIAGTDLSGDWITQPGTGQQLDDLDGGMMWRCQYRNFGNYATIVGNVTAAVAWSAGTRAAGIRWFELRKGQSGGWTLYQEGTHAPDPASRWTGSIAMDGAGNIALGYNVSSSTVYPGIRYVGRLASDPLGTLPRGEFTLIAGGGSQTGSNLWGASSAMTVDPADDSTFWFTGEYVQAGGNWATQIGVLSLADAGAITNLKINAGGSISGVNFGNKAMPPVVTVAVAPESVTENGTENLVYTFKRTSTTGGRLTVNFAVRDIPTSATDYIATYGADYTVTGAATFTPRGGTVTFAAGSDTATVTVNPMEDGIPEPDEIVVLTLVSGSEYIVGDPSAATGTITNVEFAKFWVVDDSADDVFRYRANTSLLDRWDVAPQATSPRGVATTVDGSRMWVLNYDKVVYVYDGEGALLGSWSAPQLDEPTGIATSGNDIWIVDKGTDSVYWFAGEAGRTSAAELNASFSFKLNEDNASPEGIATDGTMLWVINGEKQDRVFVYDTLGTLKGSWSIDPENTSPTGIAIDPTGSSQSIWTVDISNGRVFEYANARSARSGSRTDPNPLALLPANAGPHDLAVRGINIPPRLSFIGPQTIVAGTALTLTLTAADETLPFGALTYAAAGLPPGATFDAAAGIFHWVPVASQAPDSYHVTFFVSDGLAFDSQEVVITVLDARLWHNRSKPADVDGDGRVSPLDVLVIINRINRFGAGLLRDHQPSDPYYDVNADGEVGPVDSLLVINYLNADAEGEGELKSSEAVDSFRAGTLRPVLPEWTVGAAASSADHPGMAASRPPAATWAPDASAPDPAVGVDEPFPSGDEPSEDLLNVLAVRSRFDWWAAADDLFLDPVGSATPRTV